MFLVIFHPPQVLSPDIEDRPLVRTYYQSNSYPTEFDAVLRPLTPESPRHAFAWATSDERPW